MVSACCPAISARRGKIGAESSPLLPTRYAARGLKDSDRRLLQRCGTDSARRAIKEPKPKPERKAAESVESSAQTPQRSAETPKQHHRASAEAKTPTHEDGHRPAPRHARAREAIGRARGRGAGAHSLARHLRRRATSHAPRVVRRRPNLKRRRGDGGDAFRRCRRAVRRRGRLHDARVVNGDGGGGGNEGARTMRTHTWHAKR